MAYGILAASTNTGLDSELRVRFTAPLSIVSNQPAFASDAASLRRVVSSQLVQRWEIEAGLEPMNNSAAALIHSVRSGYNNTVYVRMPQVYKPLAQRVPEGLSFTLAGAAVIGATATTITGISAYDMKGMFVNFGTTDKKVYLIVDQTGTSVTIYPPLNSAKSAGNVVKYGNLTTMEALYDTSTMLGIKYTDGILSDPGSVKFIEKI